MKIRFATLLILLVSLYGCDDAPPSNVVLDPVPEPEPSVHVIDTYFYAQFTWGRGTDNDTVTMEVPDINEEFGDVHNYVNWVGEFRSEPIRRENESDPTIYDTVGWGYAPASILYPFDYVKLFEDPDVPGTYLGPDDPLNAPPGSEEEKVEAYNRILWISFPWRNTDTIQYWDIADYLDNPSLREEAIQWGRVGNNAPLDSVFNDDQRDGVVIHYLDEDGNLWESDNPPTFQPWGYFQIDEVLLNHRDGQSYFIVSGEMAARLYNDLGEFKELRGGKFRVRILDDIELSEQPK